MCICSMMMSAASIYFSMYGIIKYGINSKDRYENVWFPALLKKPEQASAENQLKCIGIYCVVGLMT